MESNSNSNCIVCGFYFHYTSANLIKAIIGGELVEHTFEGHKEFIHSKCKNVYMNEILPEFYKYDILCKRREKLINIFKQNYQLKICGKILEENQKKNWKYKLEKNSKYNENLDKYGDIGDDIEKMIGYNKKIAEDKINVIFIGEHKLNIYHVLLNDIKIKESMLINCNIHEREKIKNKIDNLVKIIKNMNIKFHFNLREKYSKPVGIEYIKPKSKKPVGNQYRKPNIPYNFFAKK